jgi:hypothetical protein
MCEYLKLEIELKFEISMWSVWNLKIEMFKFGCVNVKSWKLKLEIWNLFVKCLERIWNLKCLNIENWKQIFLNTKN